MLLRQRKKFTNIQLVQTGSTALGNSQLSISTHLKAKGQSLSTDIMPRSPPSPCPHFSTLKIWKSRKGENDNGKTSAIQFSTIKKN
jgi:hypothetical protein